jgi:hypothetical protein
MSVPGQPGPYLKRDRHGALLLQQEVRHPTVLNDPSEAIMTTAAAAADMIRTTGPDDDDAPDPDGFHVIEAGRRRQVTRAQAAAIMVQIAEMILAKKTQQEIAARCNVPRSSVKGWIDRIEREWLAHAAKDLDTHKAKEMAEIDRLQRMYEDGYARSMQPRDNSATYSEIGAGRNNNAKKDPTAGTIRPYRNVATRENTPEGDPRFLDGIMKCIERRIKLLGLDAPETFQMVGKRHDADTNPLAERIREAYAIFGVVVPAAPGSGPQGGDADGHGAQQPVDPDPAYIEASGVLVS